MDLNKTLEKINKDREQTEAAFVFCLWADPTLFDDYKTVNEGKDKTLKSSDAKFYYYLGRAMYRQGYKTFDNMTVYTYLQDKPEIKKKFEEYGGYKEVEQLKSLVSPDNVESYFDKIARTNTLDLMCKKYDELFSDITRFNNSTNEDIYNTFDLLNNSISLYTNHDSKVEDLIVDEDFLQECNTGDSVGLNYGKFCPLLNYTTLGAPIGDLYMIGGHSGCGKSSFIFNNFVIPFSDSGIECCIISNEMRSSTYKILLLVHILTHELNYWKLTRKKIKMGNFNEEEWGILRKAAEITKEKYSNIKFIKLNSDNIGTVLKHIKKMARLGVTSFVWDTMKSDDVIDSKMWEQLLLNSRKLYHLVDELNVSMIVTYQLALYTENQRWLSASCLANGKQIKEVFSEMVYFRRLWSDELPGGKYDCHPYKFNKDNKKIKETIELDPEKVYMVAFVDKTRNDDDKKTIIYEWQGHFNRWKELGFCTILNDHSN